MERAKKANEKNGLGGSTRRPRRRHPGGGRATTLSRSAGADELDDGVAALPGDDLLGETHQLRHLGLDVLPLGVAGPSIPIMMALGAREVNVDLVAIKVPSGSLSRQRRDRGATPPRGRSSRRSSGGDRCGGACRAWTPGAAQGLLHMYPWGRTRVGWRFTMTYMPSCGTTRTESPAYSSGHEMHSRGSTQRRWRWSSTRSPKHSVMPMTPAAGGAPHPWSPPREGRACPCGSARAGARPRAGRGAAGCSVPVAGFPLFCAGK